MKSNKSWKRFTYIILLLVLVFQLSACSGENTGNDLTKVGVAPYELSESEENLLQSFGLGNNAKAISFLAPKEAISLNVNVYTLGENNQWEATGGGYLSIGEERQPVDQLSGMFTIKVNKDHSMDFHINGAGLLSFSTDPIMLEHDDVISSVGFLQEFQEIELNTEIPVALMVYDSGTSMRTYSPQDYFEPSKFDGMDLVQVVTLTFSAKEP